MEDKQTISLLSTLSPHFLCHLGSALAISLSILGGSWGMWTCSISIFGGSIKAPRIRSKNLISVIFCEALAIYGTVVAMVMNGKLEALVDPMGPQNTLYDAQLRFVSYTYLFAGVIIGFSNLFCGIGLGVIGSSCALVDAQNPDLFMQIVTIEIFVSIIGIFGMIVGITLVSAASFPAPLNDITNKLIDIS